MTSRGRPTVDASPLRTDLVETADNTCPAGAELASLTTLDGVGLRAAFWPTSCGPARGTVLILQGRAEFIEKYFETVGDLLRRGFDVCTFDWRGQGGSGRRVAHAAKGHVADFDEYRLDLGAVGRALDDRGAAQPVVAIAHSMGGAIGLAAAHAGWLPASALAVLAPMIDLKMVRRPRLARAAARLLDRLGLGERFVPGGDGRSISTLAFPGNRLSGDAARYRRNALAAEALGPAAIGAPTIGWLAAAYRAMRHLQADGRAAAITLPVTLIAAGEDPVCLTGAAEIFAGGLAGGSGAAVIPAARHELLMETDAIRDATWAILDRFLDEHAPRMMPRLAGEEAQDGLVQPPVAASDDRAA